MNSIEGFLLPPAVLKRIAGGGDRLDKLPVASRIIRQVELQFNCPQIEDFFICTVGYKGRTIHSDNFLIKCKPWRKAIGKTVPA